MKHKINHLHQLSRKLDAARYIMQNGRPYRMDSIADLKLITALVKEEIARQIPPRAVETIESDDLTLIDGIGPRVASAFISQGITTFKQLAALDEAAILDLMKKANVHIRRNFDAAGWPLEAQALIVEETDERS